MSAAGFDDGASPRQPGDVGAARRRLSRDLLDRANADLVDALHLAERGRIRAAARLGCDSVFAIARAFLVLWGLDAGGDLAGTTALFDRQVIETELISPGLSVTVHRALRIERELREGTPVDLYEARIARLLVGARQLVEEADIVLTPLIGDVRESPPMPGAPRRYATRDAPSE